MKKILVLILLLAPFSAWGMQYTDCTPPVPLVNPKGTCFINASLQAFMAATDLATITLEKGMYGTSNGILNMLRDTIRIYRTTQAPPYHPEAFQKKMCNLLHIPYGSQEDANYCLTTLLQHCTEIDIKPGFKDALQRYPKTDTIMTPLSNLFYSQVDTLLTSVPHKFMKVLSPEYRASFNAQVTKKDRTLKNCLSNYFGGEDRNFSVDDDTLVTGRATRFLESTQDYVIIMLDRRGVHSVNNNGTCNYYRQDQPISFPLNNLDFKPYFNDKSKNKGTYELISVIMHGGSESQGHYTTYVKKAGKWYYCDDEDVSTTPKESMIEIAQRGYGVNTTVIPTTFIYKINSNQ